MRVLHVLQGLHAAGIEHLALQLIAHSPPRVEATLLNLDPAVQDLRPAFQHLCDAAWALIAHEKYAAQNETFGLFHPENPLIDQSLETRVQHYAALGRNINSHQPENLKELL